MFEYQTYPDIDQTVYMMHEKNTIKLHVKFFLRMNTWMFETCQTLQLNKIIVINVIKGAFCWILLHIRLGT
jgi:hypothetical protein